MLQKKRVLITAGPTREWMDPVRFLSNPSSGALGIAIADRLAQTGIDVTLVLGPTHLSPSKKIRTIRVVTALEMARAVKKNNRRMDAFIATAAVGDWRFARIARSKLKKSCARSMAVKLVKNPDILAATAAPLKIGFALETNSTERNARRKMRDKHLDLIIANRPDSFSSAHIRPTWIERGHRARRFPSMTKEKLAGKIAQWLIGRWKRSKD